MIQNATKIIAETEKTLSDDIKKIQGTSKKYNEAKKEYWEKPWQQSGKPFRQAYMTDLIQELIDRDKLVSSVIIEGGWMEFDTNEDYELQKDIKLCQ